MTNPSTYNSIPKSSTLLRKSDVEPCFWINEHVHTGYRPTNLSATQYIKRIFQLNNETVNIWTHLMGFFYFTWRQYVVNVHFLPSTNAHSKDYVVVTLCLFGSQVCMLMSSFYHIFGCSSAKAKRQLLRMDIFGISAGLISVYMMGVYTAFLCFEDWQKNYFALLSGISLIVIYLPLNDNITGKKLFGSQFGYTHLTYLIIATLSLGPTAHWVFLHGGFDNEHVQEWLPNLIVLYVGTGSAFLFHISMVPERFLPGVFDVVGSSHQWWHILILGSLSFWLNSSLDYLALHRSYPYYCFTHHGLLNVTS